MYQITLAVDSEISTADAVTSKLRELMVRCSSNVGGMKVKSAVLDVNREPDFLKRHVLPFGQRDGVLAALNRMEKDRTIT